jgi:GTP-binding protein HflX
LVFNKMDAMAPETRPVLLEDVITQDALPTKRIFVSARSGEGLPGLRRHLLGLAVGHRSGAPELGYGLEVSGDAPQLGTIGS